MLLGITLLSFLCTFNAYVLKDDEQSFKEVTFDSLLSKDVDFAHRFNSFASDTCSCKNGHCVKDSNGHQKCMCKPKHSMKEKDCEACYCGVKGKCIFTETFSEETKRSHYEKKCLCDTGYADKKGTCTECVCGINSKCEFENEEKICYCIEGYAELQGVCTECNCGEGGSCEFQNGEKICTCYDGYQFDGKVCKSIPPPNLCQDASIDAATTTQDGRTYVFKGDYYWEVKETGVSYHTFIPEGYPQKIREDWDGLPGDLDAALTTRDGKTYFFKKNECWRFRTNKKMDAGYPKAISVEFEGIPDNIDAAVVWSGNGKPYFFKGSKYWRYDSGSTPHVGSSFPLPISMWTGLPDNIDAALPWLHNTTHFFKGASYYRFDDIPSTVHKIPPPYPRPSSEWWFGC